MTGFALEILKQNRYRLDKVALIDRNGYRKITWESLADKICRVAAYAKKTGLKGIVPVHMDRGMEVTATLLGLNLVGVGVAPLAITMPLSRCAAISAQVGNEVWTMETFNKACECAPAYELCVEGAEADPAYVVFTSGSTGTPKGVMLSNRAMLGGMHRAISHDFYDMNQNDIMLQSSSLSFIALDADLFAPLYAGTLVYVLPEEARGDLHMMEDFINRHGITCLFMSPQMYRNFQGGPSLKCVCIGGDRIVNIEPKGHRLVSVYGMTEMAGYAFHYDITTPAQSTPIGEPCDDVRAYVLDEDGNEAEEGEMCVSGAVAHAYLGLDELNESTFTPNPFTDDPDHSYLLHSGDIVRRIDEGGFLYVNRKDNMIKLNGQRVEPGEIEVVLMDYPGVDVAVAKGFTDDDQHSIICAYYTCNRAVDEDKMRAYLADRLPHYMVPSIFVKMDKMPLNNNGKLDRKALAMPDLSQYLAQYEKPVGVNEEIICRAFETALGLDRVGRNDDFFRIGGDSISALTVVSECESLGISTGDIFAGRTPKAIAVLADNTVSSIYKDLHAGSEKSALTDSQMGILLECGLDEESTKYNIPVHMSFDRTADMTAASIKDAVDTVLRNHPALYAQITEEAGNFFMLRRSFAQEGICEAAEADEADIEKYVEATAAPIAIGRGPLCTAKAYLCKDKVHVLMNMHHVVSDGSSVAVMTRELSEVLDGKDIEPEIIDAFSLREAEERISSSKAMDDARTYFSHLLSGVETDSNLIADHKAEDAGRHAVARRTIEIDRASVESFLAYTGFTANTFFMGVYGYALAKMTGLNESVFGVAESGRDNGLLKNTVSMLVKTLPVVLKIDEEKTGRELLTQLQSQFFATMRNDCLGFAYLAKEYDIRSDVMFVYQSDMLNGASGEDIHVDLDILETGEALNNFNLMVLKQDEKFILNFDYRSDMYEDHTIVRFAEVYRKSAEAFIKGSVLKDITLISESDLRFLDEENAAACHDLEDENILEMLRDSVKKHPDKAAVIYEDRNYTYAQVDEISDRIAAYLIGRGIGRGCVVSILIQRCEYILIASLGVMKAGAAYQPLDPSYPQERLGFMVNDAKAALIIKDRKLDHILKDYEGDVLYTDEIGALPQASAELPQISLDDIYVLLYTSGTTGTPKGVMLTHANLKALAVGHAYTRELEEDSIVAQYASYGFDAHMADIYPAVYKGATITIVPDEIRLDLAGIKDFCEASHVTHLCMTTQVARQFAVAYPEVKGLKVVDCGGEKLVAFTPPKTYQFVNLYGPTEGTVCSSKFVVDKYYDNIPIGKSVNNFRLYVVDAYGRRMPVGAPGELILCGPQVGAGYLGRPEETAKAFVPNTFENVGAHYERCYKTGDVVRFINDGNIEFIGRRDHQVKIRGFRIELGEVEKAIRDYPAVKDATVAVIDKDGVKSLCAYVVSDEKIDVADLNRCIGESHPAYMVPAVTMQLESIPLNVNGKVDKKKLPKPEIHFDDITKPETELQQQIFDCVSEAIGTDEFGIDTDIFMAGLTSIGSIRLCTLLAEKLDVPIKIRDLKRCQTVRGLEGFIRESRGMDEEIAVSERVFISDDKDKTAEAIEYGPSYPITKTMEGIFTECLQRPGSTIYNIPYLLKLGAGIDESKLKKAIVDAVEAHPCMKAELFTDKDGNVCQHRRADDVFTESEIKEIRYDSPDELGSGLVTPFELMNQRLFEISLIHADGTYLFINVHHIIFDGTSMVIFVKDIEKAYAGDKLDKEKFSSFDIAQEEKQSRTKAELEAERKYYDALLEGTDKDFLLIADKYADDHEASGKFIMEQREADASVIKSFCDSHRTGMNAYFLSVFGTVLARYMGTDYSVFNTVYNGRNDSRTMNTAAMLVKTLPVVCHADKEKVSELTGEISKQLMDSMANDLYSYAEISKTFGVKNDVMFIYQGDSFTMDSFCGEAASEVALQLSDAKTSMTLQVMIRNGKLVYELEYDPKRFTEALAQAFVQAVDNAAALFTKEEKLSDITLLSESAEAEMEKHNATQKDYDKSRTIADLFLEQVKARPDTLCVEYNNKRYTFAQIGELTGKLSYFLMTEGVGRGDVVSILINRDENMVIGAHGVNRTGAAYLGLDPTYPPERLEFMIKDSGSKYLIADRKLIGILKDYEGKVIYTDEIEGLKAPSDDEMDALIRQEAHDISPEDNALIVYSSGTTGIPKGTMLRHRNIVCFYHNYTADEDIGPGSNVATYASFGFDGGAMDVFCVPMAGASLYVIPDDIRLDLIKLEQFYVKNGITTGFMTTQVGCMFISNTKCRTLKNFIVGGEKFIPVLAPKWVCFKNGYGPSETMCYVNRYLVKDKGTLQPIGKVSDNTKEYIIDRYGNRVPYGACGELCIAGGQVGKGYLGRPEKTAEAFVENPFSDDPEYAVMYRTGDVVRMLTDGNYDFVGRRDGQVKIRGFRIELGEVEQQIRKYPGVTKAVVTAYDNPSGGKYLTAYVVMDETLDVNDLKDFIGKEKPDYMVPTVIMQLDDIPLTSNGKVDANKLPKPQLGAAKKGAGPANATEEKICNIFAEVIGVDKVYADDDFFKIGGSSISAIQVVVKCDQEGLPVVYKNLFANPTAQKLAAFISDGNVNDINASDLNKNDEYDYSALKYNVIENLPNIRNDGVGDVLLTGATGFLGSHIFRELIESTSGQVICLVRSKDGLAAATRFEAMMTYYFEDWYKDEMKPRTVIIDGELEDEDIRERLKAIHFDTIINCAANVKHFAVENELMTANFSGVENLIEVAEESGAKLIQISSMSVCGESVNGSVPKDYIFKETDLNIGQSLENKYIYTKYLGEQAVIDAVSRKRIRGKIIRLGNLMARIDDSQFQVNAGQNGMLRMFFGFVKLGCFPIDMLDSQIEFSPIDSVARAVVMLSGTPDDYTVFHARNCNSIHYGYMLKAVMDAGYPVEVVENDVFEERLQKALENADSAVALGGLLAYRNSTSGSLTDVTQHSADDNLSTTSETRVKITNSDTYTTKALYRLGFGWPLVSMDYLHEMVNVLVDLDFFED